MLNRPTPAHASLLVKGLHRYATCWRLERQDGTILRITDHDSPLSIGGFTYTPASSPISSARARAHGRPANAEVQGAIQATAITEADLRAGLYRNCKVVEFVVDYRYPFTASTPSGPGSFVENHYIFEDVTFDGETWVAAIQGKLYRLNAVIGVLLERECRFTLGDPNTCGVDLGALEESGTVSSVSTAKRVFTSSIVGQVDDYFRKGKITWTSGANAGVVSEVAKYEQAGGVFHLFVQTPHAIAASDAFDVVPGCLKRFEEDCIAKFSNGKNFGGFPDIPGTDDALETPSAL